MTTTGSHPRSEDGGITDGSAEKAVEHLWMRIERSLRRAARSMTPDADLQDDLVQEALIKLWELDPTRYDVRKESDIFYLRRVLINRMLAVARAEIPSGPLIQASV